MCPSSQFHDPFTEAWHQWLSKGLFQRIVDDVVHTIEGVVTRFAVNNALSNWGADGLKA